MGPLPIVKRVARNTVVVPVRHVGRKFYVTIRLPDTVLYIKERILVSPDDPWSHYADKTYWSHTRAHKHRVSPGTVAHSIIKSAFSVLAEQGVK